MNRRDRRSSPAAHSAGPNRAQLDEAARQAGAFFQAGRLRECEITCRNILARDADHPEANLLMGLLALSSRRNEEAVALLKQAVAGNRKNPVAHANLGLALAETGRLSEAVTSLQTALRLKPGYPEALTNLASVESRLGRYAQATAHNRKALALMPGNPVLRRNLAGALYREGHIDEAVTHYRELLAGQPEDPETHYGLGLALREQGDIAEAEAHLRRATELRSTHAEAAHAWVWMSDDVSDADYAEIRAARAETPDESSERMLLDFALGKIEHERGDYAGAARHLREANALRRADLDYDRARADAEFAETKAVFTRDFFAARQGFGFEDETPIFVLGMPRSGTSLIEQILASHPDVHGAGELTVLREIAGFSAGENPPSPPEFAKALSKGVSATLGRKYVREVRALSPGSRFIVDKLPGNFMLIGLIRLILPQARIIHCTRDPRDTCLSMYRTNFSGRGLAFAYDLDELVDYYGQYESLMAHWKSVFGETIIEANHEKLLADPEGEIRRLLASCDLAFHPQCLEFHKTRRTVRTASAAQVRRPLYDSSKRGWRGYIEHLPELGRLAAD